MDQVGIDHCLINPGGYWQMLEFIGAGRAAGAARCNDYLAEQLSDHIDRLHGVAIVDFGDLVGAAKELERARRRGHRAFFLYTMDGRPPAAVPPGHPDWDVVWAAATRLGMVASIHIGNTAANFSGWADIGWDRPAGGGVTALTRLANTQRIHVAQNLLVSMLYGGVFRPPPDTHRHPGRDEDRLGPRLRRCLYPPVAPVARARGLALRHLRWRHAAPQRQGDASTRPR